MQRIFLVHTEIIKWRKIKMKKRTLRLGWLVVAIMLPLVMGACATWRQPGPGFYHAHTIPSKTNPGDSNFAKWGRVGLVLLGFSPTAR